MTPDHALELMMGAFKVAFFLMGPILLGALIAGATVGILQTATQINEASISYVAKLAMIVVVMLLLGPSLAAEAIRYTSQSFAAIETVVR